MNRALHLELLETIHEHFTHDSPVSDLQSSLIEQVGNLQARFLGSFTETLEYGKRIFREKISPPSSHGPKRVKNRVEQCFNQVLRYAHLKSQFDSLLDPFLFGNAKTTEIDKTVHVTRTYPVVTQIELARLISLFEELPLPLHSGVAGDILKRIQNRLPEVSSEGSYSLTVLAEQLDIILNLAKRKLRYSSITSVTECLTGALERGFCFSSLLYMVKSIPDDDLELKLHRISLYKFHLEKAHMQVSSRKKTSALSESWLLLMQKQLMLLRDTI
ncbi:MAG: hypothetical protein A3F09_03605 [Chlamydiae bacterium RIFCSPHIGHO2_12_FULL_49_11]|nr:MAG: hypothetical protein A3F09_03605 [Chlamydiae bacterium RIFCSPHIGHO2_12_FULL_49_11]